MWKERTNKVFKGVLLVVEDVVHLVFVRIAKWVSSKKEFDDLRVDWVLFNWEVSPSSGVSKARKLDS